MPKWLVGWMKTSETMSTDGMPTAAETPTVPTPIPHRRRIIRRNGQRLERREEVIIPAAPEPPAQTEATTKPPARELTEAEAEAQMDLTLNRMPVPYAQVGNVRVTPDMLRATEKLGLSKKRWNYETRIAIEQLGDWFNVPFVGKMLMIDGFDGIEQIQCTMKHAREIMEMDSETLKSKGYKAADVLVAGELMTLCAKELRGFIEQGMKMAKELAPKTNGQERRRNRPPLALQVNVNNAPQPATATPGPIAKVGYTEPVETESR